MVVVLIKRNDQAQFLCETTLSTPVADFLDNVTSIFNARLKVERVCSEMEELAAHGTLLPPEILGLTDDQVEELKLIDEWGERCIPSGGFEFNKDPVGRRNGKAPKKSMQEVLTKTMKEAKDMVSKDLVKQDEALTLKTVHGALELLKGAVTIVYPMKLPPHDVIRQEFENTEDLSGTQASLDVIDPALAQLWFCGKELYRDKTVGDYVGKNEKCRVIMKLSKKGQGPPGREPIMTEEQKKEMMMHAYRRQEELKKLEEDADDHYLDSKWADSSSLKRGLHGMNNISWRPK